MSICSDSKINDALAFYLDKTNRLVYARWGPLG
jgi:hypothetical protein